MKYDLDYFLWQYIWWGLLPKAEIISSLDYFEGELIEQELLNKKYAVLLKKQAELIEKNKFSDDFSKLANVFQALNERGIITAHNAGSTSSAGFSSVDELERTIRQKVYRGIIDFDPDKLKGFCFYHEQNIEELVADINSSIIPSDSIHLAFGVMDEEATISPIEIGKEICELLAQEGLKYSWNGHKESKIELLNFVWMNINDGTNWENAAYQYFIDQHKIDKVATLNLKVGGKIDFKHSVFEGNTAVITSIDKEAELIKVKGFLMGKEVETVVYFDDL